MSIMTFFFHSANLSCLVSSVHYHRYRKYFVTFREINKLSWASVIFCKLFGICFKKGQKPGCIEPDCGSSARDKSGKCLVTDVVDQFATLENGKV